MHVIGTAGHVDHGKSTLVERLTGIDPDRFEEEKRRGLTIDLGFAWLTLPSGNEIGIIDVPGHERFIRNMLAGAGGTTICLFVVAANEGWKPQSAEHLAILDTLGADRGVVALTKADLVDPDTLELTRLDVTERIGRSSLAGAPIVACSAHSGAGLEDLVAALDRLVSDATPPVDRGRPRLWVDRVFTVAGAGTVVTGTLGGGSLAVGDDVEIAPEGRRARIRTIQSHKRSAETIAPGNRTALNLAGLDREGARRGDAIVVHGEWHPTRRIHALVRVLDPDLSGQAHELREKGAHLLYVGTAETPVQVKLVGADRIEPGASGYAELNLREPLPLMRGDRFVLRDVGRVLTFGGGIVLDPRPSLVRNDPRLTAYLTSISDVDPSTALERLVEAEGTIPLREALLRSGADRPADGSRALGSSLVSEAYLRELSERAITGVRRYHQEHPLRKGMDREELRAELGVEELTAFDDLVHAIPGLVSDGPVVRMQDHVVAFDGSQQDERVRLLETLEADGLNPPAADGLQIDPALLRALADAGEIVRVDGFYLTAKQIEEIKKIVVSFIRERGPATVAQLRDAMQTSRKYAVPICEWLDQQGITRRDGNDRVLGPRAPHPD